MTIGIVGMLDEREAGLTLIKDHIEQKGHRTLLIDISMGTGAIDSALKADITCDEVALAGGAPMESVREMLAKERDKATSTMAEGLGKKLLDIHEAGDLKGVIAVGGMTGTFITLTAMKKLPFGLPKLLISSVAAMPAYGPCPPMAKGLQNILV